MSSGKFQCRRLPVQPGVCTVSTCTACIQAAGRVTHGTAALSGRARLVEPQEVGGGGGGRQGQEQARPGHHRSQPQRLQGGSFACETAPPPHPPHCGLPTNYYTSALHCLWRYCGNIETAANERCPARVCPRRAVEELGQGGEGGAPPVLGPVTTTTAACGGTRRSTGHGALQDVPPQSPRPPPPPLLELPLLALLGGRGGAVAAAAAARARTGSMKLDSKSASSATASLGSGARLFCEPQPQPMPHSTPSTLSAQCRRHEGAEYPDTQYSSGNERPQGSAQRSTGRSSRDNSVRRSDHAAHEGALLGAGPPGHL